MKLPRYIEDISTYDTSKIAGITEIVSQVLGIKQKDQMKTLVKTSGTYNNVRIIQVRTKKYAIRMSKKPIVPKLFSLVNATKRNWQVASKHGICPHVLYNGYYKHRSGLLFEIIIMEAYDTDLSTYYKTMRQKPTGTTLSDTDEIIASNLMKQIYKLASANVWLECVDLKPLNIVIDLKSLDVRLIDLDGDFCSIIQPAMRSIATVTQVYLEGCIVMACHLYHKYNNILFCYFQTFPREYLVSVIETIMQRPIASTRFTRNIIHYFGPAFSKPFTEKNISQMADEIVYWAQHRYPSNTDKVVTPNTSSCTKSRIINPLSHTGCISKTQFKKQILSKTHKKWR